MMNEVGDDTDPLQELAANFSTGYVGHTICATVDELRIEISQRLTRITKLVPYLSGMYFSDHQRRMAEAEIFRLQVEVGELAEKVSMALMMAPELGRPVTINS